MIVKQFAPVTELLSYEEALNKTASKEMNQENKRQVALSAGRWC